MCNMLLNFDVKIFIIVFFLNSHFVFSQVQYDEIENEIQSYQDTDIAVISKSRKMIKEKIELNDNEKISAIYTFVNNKFDSTQYIAFEDEEQWLILMWLKDFAQVLDVIKIYNPKTDDFLSKKILPPIDFLNEKLKFEVDDKKDEICDAIKLSELELFEKQFLLIFLEYIILSDDEKKSFQENINVMATNYLNNFPNSYLENYVRKYIRFIYKLSNFAGSFNFNFGYHQYQGNLGEFFSDILFFGIVYELQYKKFMIGIRGAMGYSSNVKKEFDYNGHWERDLPLIVFEPEMMVGFEIIDLSKFKILPYCGVGFMDIASPEKIAEEPGNDVEMTYVMTYNVGLNIDLKFKPITFYSQYRRETGYTNIRIRMGVSYPQYENKLPELTGKKYFIELGFGLSIRRLVRDL